MQNNFSHVVVIGAGAFGCAITLQLALAGVRVTLVDSGDTNSQASLHNGGNLNPLLMTPPALLPLALESFNLHRQLPAVLSSIGVQPHRVNPVRRLLLALTEEETKPFDAIEQSFACQGNFSTTFSTTRLNRQQLKSLEPALIDGLHSALLLEGNLAVDGEDFLRALKEAAQKIGAIILPGKASGLGSAGNRANSVQCGEQDIACDAIVLASGAHIADTKAWLDISLPVMPVKGQMLRMELAGFEQNFDMTHGEITLYKRRGNEIWVGMTQELGISDLRPTTEGRDFLLEGAARIFPRIADAWLLAHTAAIRPTTASGLPIVAKANGWENIYLANGGGMKGMLLCTGVARMLHELMFNSNYFISGLQDV